MFRTIALFLLCAFIASCSARDSSIVERRRKVEIATDDQDQKEQGENKNLRADEPFAMRVNRTLLYPVQWGRAEDMAATLEPLLLSLYGPGARISVHRETNHLLIHIPPLSERETGRPGTATSPSPSRRNGTTTPRTRAR